MSVYKSIALPRQEISRKNETKKNYLYFFALALVWQTYIFCSLLVPISYLSVFTLTHIHISTEENIHDIQFSQEPKDAHTATSSMMLLKLVNAC